MTLTKEDIKAAEEYAIECLNSTIPMYNSKQSFLAGVMHEREKGKIQPIPYQCCPVCNGAGKVISDGFTSTVYQICRVCNDAKIIPMYAPEPPKI